MGTKKVLIYASCLLFSGIILFSCNDKTSKQQNVSALNDTLSATKADTTLLVQDTLPQSIIPQLEQKEKLTLADMTDARIAGLFGKVKKVVTCNIRTDADGAVSKDTFISRFTQSGEQIGSQYRYIDSKHYATAGVTFSDVDSVIYAILFEQNSKGSIRKEVAANLDENVEHSYIFDKYGRLTLVDYDPDYSSEGWFNTIYEYTGNDAFPTNRYNSSDGYGERYNYLEADSCGNWTKRTVTHLLYPSGEIRNDFSYTQTRTITYY
jgi:hypothetical protein